MARTQTTMVIRRMDDDYYAVVVEADVDLSTGEVEVGAPEVVRVLHCELLECTLQPEGAPLPLSPREMEEADRVLGNEAEEDARDRLEDWGERFYETHDYDARSENEDFYCDHRPEGA